jgi:hypothetical protein
MARIPDHVVERLKAEVSVQRLAEVRGVACSSPSWPMGPLNRANANPISSLAATRPGHKSHTNTKLDQRQRP